MGDEPSTENRAGSRWTLHQAFGLTIRSEIALPELLPAPHGAADQDVEIVYGAVPAELPDATVRGVRYQAAPGALLLRVEGIAAFLVRDGRRIVIERDAAAADDDVRLFLLGSALGALLHQRRDLVLHGTAVAVGEECVAFLGRSGVGKSTLAIAFRERGYPVLADDLCVVRAGRDGRPEIQPGYPQAKLWLDSLAELKLPADELRKIRRDVDKRALPLGESFAGRALPVRKVYVLQPTNRDEIRVISVAGPGRLAVLKNQTYRFQFLEGTGSKVDHFKTALELGRRVPVSLVVRPLEPFRLAELVDHLEADFSP